MKLGITTLLDPLRVTDSRVTIRILQIIPTLVRGGAEKQLALLAAGLPRDRFEVHVCVLTHSGPLEENLRAADIPLSFINKRWKIDPFAYWRLRSEIKRLQPDIVQTWLFAANAYGRQAAISTNVKHILASERCVDPWKGAVQLSIELAGFTLGQVRHLGGDDLEAGAFETGIDLADDILGDGVGFDDGEGAFDSHLIAPQS